MKKRRTHLLDVHLIEGHDDDHGEELLDTHGGICFLLLTLFRTAGDYYLVG